MSNSGTYQLLVNDGQQDGLLNQKKLLQNNLLKAARMRARRGDKDPYPTLRDVQQTHVLFTKANWKPFAPLTSDYVVSNASAGTQALGSQVTMEIPNYGDFFSDLHVRIVLAQPTLTVDAGVADQDAPAMRWCEYPGERLLESVELTIVNNRLDNLTYEDYAVYRKTKLQKDKEDAWKRMMGQEIPHTGYGRQVDWAGSGAAPDASRVQHKVCNGLQTPSAQKSGEVELLIPILMWFSDVRTAIPGIALPHGQRFLTLRLAASEKLVSLVPRGNGSWSAPNGTLSQVQLSEMQLVSNNLFTVPHVHEIYVQRLQFSLMRVHLQHNVQLSKNEETVRLDSFKWPVEYFWVGARRTEVEDLSTQAQHQHRWSNYSYAQAVTAYSTDVMGDHVEQLAADAGTTIDIDVSGNVSVSAGATYFNAGVDGAGQLTVGDELVYHGQHFGVLTVPTDTTAILVTVPGIPIAAAPATDFTVVSKRRGGIVVDEELSLIDELQLDAHGNEIFKRATMKRFNSYFPWHYGQGSVRAPEDVGLAFVNFARYPGGYQPSGHMNLSRARDTHLKVWGSQISTQSCRLFAAGCAINFCLVVDGAIVRRFA